MIDGCLNIYKEPVPHFVWKTVTGHEYFYEADICGI
jgi:hypothetical protein